MRIRCESCGAVVPDMAIDHRRGMAVCSACRHAFSCQNQLDDAVLRNALRQETRQPAGIGLVRQSDGIVMTRRWFGMMFVRLAFVTLVFNLFMAVWYHVVVRRGQWFPVAFPAVCGGANLALLYSLIASLVNTTRITAGPTRIEVRHGPLPWLGHRVLAPERVRQLDTRERVAHTKHGHRVTYEVWAELHQGRDVLLVGGLPRENQASFIQEQVESACGI